MLVLGGNRTPIVQFAHWRLSNGILQAQYPSVTLSVTLSRCLLQNVAVEFMAFRRTLCWHAEGEVRWWNVGKRKLITDSKRGGEISWAVERLSACQDGLYCVELMMMMNMIIIIIIINSPDDSYCVLLYLVAVDRFIPTMCYYSWLLEIGWFQLCVITIGRFRSVDSYYVLLQLVALDWLIPILCYYSWSL